MMRDGRYDVFDEVKQRVDAALLRLANRIKMLLIRQVKIVLDQNKVNDTGDLRKGIDGRIEQETSRIIVEIFANTSYSQWVHEGTKPHYPPLAKIRDWVRRKGLAGKYSIRSGRRLGNNITKEQEDDQLARRIAWKIAQKGTKGIKFFEIALKQADSLIMSEVEKFKI